ncbi:hypothetical protein SBA2_420003 [Acidobacteriia bacterium SbA2]|nr:hypothetical protein SBA2_420003 [Acidobacteriia bacterium SbA2]
MRDLARRFAGRIPVPTRDPSLRLKNGSVQDDATETERLECEAAPLSEPSVISSAWLTAPSIE